MPVWCGDDSVALQELYNCVQAVKHGAQSYMPPLTCIHSTCGSICDSALHVPHATVLRSFKGYAPPLGSCLHSVHAKNCDNAPAAKVYQGAHANVQGNEYPVVQGDAGLRESRKALLYRVEIREEKRRNVVPFQEG